MDTNDYKKYSLFLKTGQTANIKTLFEVIKDVLMTDINIVFTPEFIKIGQMNHDKTTMVYLNLNSEAFEKYHCEKKVVLGVNVADLYKIIKIAKGGKEDETISLFVEKDKNDHLGIRMENSTENRTFESYIKLLDIEFQDLDIPELEYPSVITLPSTKFQKYIKDLNSLGSDLVLDITSVGQQLIFSTVSDFSENKAIFGSSTDTVINNDENSTDIVQGKFSLPFLILFTKATGLSGTVQIYLKNDKPIILEYTVGNLGIIRFVLSPNFS